MPLLFPFVSHFGELLKDGGSDQEVSFIFFKNILHLFKSSIFSIFLSDISVTPLQLTGGKYVVKSNITH